MMMSRLANEPPPNYGDVVSPKESPSNEDMHLESVEQ